MLCGRDAGDYIALKRQALCEAAARGCCALGGERGGGRIASSGGRPPVSSLLSDARPSPVPQRGAEGGGAAASRNPSGLHHHTHSRGFRRHRSRIMYSRYVVIAPEVAPLVSNPKTVASSWPRSPIFCAVCGVGRDAGRNTGGERRSRPRYRLQWVRLEPEQHDGR